MMSSEQGRKDLSLRLCESATNGESSRGKSHDQEENSITPRSLSVMDESLSHHSSMLSLVDEKETPVLPQFPSLQLRLLEKGSKRRKLPLNAQEPVDFETELFKGKVLVIVRPNHPEKEDPYWNERIFAQKRRRIIIQIQGKFQYLPQGVVYAGAEITELMKLGLVTKGLSKILLTLLQGFYQNLHHSFGDNEELAHIVAPADQFFQRIVVTKPGEIPPAMDTGEFEEKSSMQQPLNQQQPFKNATNTTATAIGPWNTSDTYSFSFYSMYIDLPTWQLVGLPASGDLSLKTFWRNAALRICMYEKTSKDCKKHIQKFINYAFVVQAKFLGRHGTTIDGDADSSDEETENNIITWSERRSSISQVHSVKVIDRTESMVLFEESPSSEEEEEEGSVFFDAVADDSEKEDTRMLSRDVSKAPTIVSVEVASIPLELLAAIDTVVPAWLDCYVENDNKNGGSYATMFAINVGSKTLFHTQRSCEDLIGKGPKRDLHSLLSNHFSPRLSSLEKLRRLLGLTLSRTSQQTGIPADRVQEFLEQNDDLKGNFLRSTKHATSNKGGHVIRIAGVIARAMSDRHWIENWGQVCDRFITFSRLDNRKVQFRLRLSDIIRVEYKRLDRCPHFIGYHVMILLTPGRSVYIMFKNEEELEHWQHIIGQCLPSGQLLNDEGNPRSSDDTNSYRSIEIENPADQYLLKSTMWNCKNRRVLNCARFCFRQTAASNAGVDPLSMAETALMNVMQLLNGDSDDLEKRRVFLDSASELKRASVQNLSEAERLAFFLNVYHTMISHAFLVLGPPDSSLKWLTYFNNIAYEVSDDIFSLAELEHCIVRAKMSNPTQILSRFVVPKSMYEMAVRKVDYRINFALNCGSLSNPKHILVYRANQINEQLDQASSLYLNCVTYRRTGSGDLELKLPRIIHWYFDDFGDSRQVLLLRIQPHLNPEIQRQLAGCWLSRERKFDMTNLDIRYLAYDFNCRSLSLFTEEN
jgi:hypothetical protein